MLPKLHNLEILSIEEWDWRHGDGRDELVVPLRETSPPSSLRSIRISFNVFNHLSKGHLAWLLSPQHGFMLTCLSLRAPSKTFRRMLPCLSAALPHLQRLSIRVLDELALSDEEVLMPLLLSSCFSLRHLILYTVGRDALDLPSNLESLEVELVYREEHFDALCRTLEANATRSSRLRRLIIGSCRIDGRSVIEDACEEHGIVLHLR